MVARCRNDALADVFVQLVGNKWRWSLWHPLHGASGCLNVDPPTVLGKSSLPVAIATSLKHISTPGWSGGRDDVADVGAVVLPEAWVGATAVADAGAGAGAGAGAWFGVGVPAGFLFFGLFVLGGRDCCFAWPSCPPGWGPLVFAVALAEVPAPVVPSNEAVHSRALSTQSVWFLE